MPGRLAVLPMIWIKRGEENSLFSWSRRSCKHDSDAIEDEKNKERSFFSLDWDVGWMTSIYHYDFFILIEK